MKKFLIFVCILFLGGGIFLWRQNTGNTISPEASIQTPEIKTTKKDPPPFVEEWTELLDRKIEIGIEAKRIGDRIFWALERLGKSYPNLSIPEQLLERGDFTSLEQVELSLKRIRFFEECRVQLDIDLNFCRKVFEEYVRSVRDYDLFVKNFSKGGNQ